MDKDAIASDVGLISRFLQTLKIDDGELDDHLTERNFRLYARRSPKQPRSVGVDVSTLRSLAVTLGGERLPLRRESKPPRTRAGTELADVKAAAIRIVENKDADAAAALIAVLCDVRFEDFPEITSTRELMDRQLYMPDDFRRVCEKLIDELPLADLGTVSVATWQRARIVPIEGRPQLAPMCVRILRNQLLANELDLSVADLLRNGVIFPITRLDELSQQTEDGSDWCRLLGQPPVADVLFDEIQDQEQSETMPTRPPSRSEARRRARELAARHDKPEPLPPSFQAWLDQYEPVAASVAPYWDEIGETVVQVAVRIRNVPTLVSFKRVVAVVAQIFAEAAMHGRTLDPVAVLSDRNINRFVHTMRGIDQTRSTYRSDLRRAARFWPGTGLVEKPIQMPRKSLTAPYSGREIKVLARVIGAEPNTDRGRNAKCFFGLGIGAGIRSREINCLTAADFWTDEATGLLIVEVPEVGAHEARSVPLLPEWDELVRPNLPEAGRLAVGAGKNWVSSCYQRISSTSKHPPIKQNRLRNTWLVQQMASPDVKAEALLRRAGLVSPRILEDLLPYVPLEQLDDQTEPKALEGEV